MKDKSILKKVSKTMFWIAIVIISVDASFNFINKSYYFFAWKSLVVCWMVYSAILECQLDNIKEKVQEYRKKLKLED